MEKRVDSTKTNELTRPFGVNGIGRQSYAVRVSHSMDEP
jgi:hypothetical protein